MLSQLEHGHHVGQWTRSIVLRDKITESLCRLADLLQLTTNLKLLTSTAGLGPELLKAEHIAATMQSLQVLKISFSSRISERDTALSLLFIGQFLWLEELSITMRVSPNPHYHMRTIDLIEQYRMPWLRSLEWFYDCFRTNATPFFDLLARSTFRRLETLKIGMLYGESYTIQAIAPFMKRHNSIKQIFWHLPEKLMMEAIALSTSADVLAFNRNFKLSHIPGAVSLSPSVRVIVICGPSAMGPFDNSEILTLYESILTLSAVPDLGSLREIHISLSESPFRWRNFSKLPQVTAAMYEKLRESITLLADRGLLIFGADGCTFDATDSPQLLE
jgi:hypothetical protein